MSTTPTAWHDPQISYWHATAPLSQRSDLASDPLPAEAPVVVIGGGLMGSCTAYWLARAGVRVVLLEQQAPAFGATGRNGGFHVVGTAEPYAEAIQRHGHAAARTIYGITHASRGLIRQVMQEERLVCDYREPGRLNLALTVEAHTAQQASVAALHADGFPMELLDRQAVQQLIDTPLGPEIVGALYASEDGMLHSARFIQELQAAARRHGARLCHATVSGISEQHGDTSVATSAGTIRTAGVVVAVNAWTSQLVPAMAGVIKPVRGQILNYAPTRHVFRPGVGAAVTPTGEYWHQTPDGAIVLGGCRAVAADGEVGVLAEGLHDEVQSAIEQVFPRLFPQLDGLRIERRWSGPMAFTADYNPICDRAPGMSNTWFVGGFSGHGMPFGMRLGQLLAEAVQSNQKPGDMEALRLDRPTLG